MTDTPTRADLIKRLLSVDVSWSEVGEWCAEAAAALTADAERIEALTAEVERLRGEIVKAIDAPMIDHSGRKRGIYDVLRAALKGTDHDPA